jgi:hypothetical protein
MYFVTQGQAFAPARHSQRDGGDRGWTDVPVLAFFHGPYGLAPLITSAGNGSLSIPPSE